MFDRRRPSPKRVPVAVVGKVLGLYRDRYFDLNVRHFHEKLKAEHQVDLSYSWVKGMLQGAGLVARERKRGVHRKRRPRRPLPGMLLHIDGSRHRWLQEEGWHDLIVILDDATSEIYHAQLVEEESTVTVMAALWEVIARKGLLCALYSDRGSNFWLTPKAGGAVDPQRPTQVGRALRNLGIQMIPAYSPQARGRSERNFGTWQGRLPQELRIHGIKTVEAANRFLRERYMAEFNQRFQVAAAERGSVFLPRRGQDLARAFSLQWERTVNRDITVTWQNLTLQIEPVKWRATLAGCTVIVHQHLDATLSLYFGPHCLARYSALGVPATNSMACLRYLKCPPQKRDDDEDVILRAAAARIIDICFRWFSRQLKPEKRNKSRSAIVECAVPRVIERPFNAQFQGRFAPASTHFCGRLFKGPDGFQAGRQGNGGTT